MLRGVVFVDAAPWTTCSRRWRQAAGLSLDALPASTTTPASRRRRWPAAPGCERATPTGLQHERPCAFAGRQWDLRVAARAPDAAATRRPAAPGRCSLPSGLLSAAMLGACC